MPPKKKLVNLPSTPPPVRSPEFMKANEQYIIAGAQAEALRNSVRTALIMAGLDTTPEAVAYLSKKMVEKERVSLLDEIEGMRGQAKRVFR